MKRSNYLTLMLVVFSCYLVQPALGQGRFLNKLKNKTEDKAIDKIFGKDEEKENPAETNSPYNTKGSGLTKEPPDVLANIGEAENAFSEKKYTKSRYAVRQAIMGIELEIGNNILDELPGEIRGLPAVKDEDMVASTGIGFAGLIIERTYRKDDKEFKVSVANESAWLSAANMYLASGGQYSEDDDHKIVEFGDDRAVLEYDEYSGYKLSVPFGQSSILITEGINFENEDEMMDASGEINIANIKKELGEE